MLFDSYVSENVVVNQFPSSPSSRSLNMNMKNLPVSSSSGDLLFPIPPNQPPFQQSNSGRGRGYGNSKMQCQLCGKFGHLVHRFFQRFNVHFTGVTDPSYKSLNDLSVHMTSAQWDDVGEVENSP